MNKERMQTPHVLFPISPVNLDNQINTTTSFINSLEGKALSSFSIHDLIMHLLCHH